MKLHHALALGLLAFPMVLPIGMVNAQEYHQEGPGGPPIPKSHPVRPGPPRYTEDYSDLKDPASRTRFFDPIRHIDLNRDRTSYLKIGGGVRYKYDHYNHSGYGLEGASKDGYLQQRLDVNFDLHLFNDAARVFVQLENTHSWGKKVYSPYDQSASEVQQAFMDLRLFETPQGKFMARVGRQEIAYGDQILMNVREVPNLRLTFDGVMLTYQTPEGYKFDAFAVRPVANLRTGSFNDSSSVHESGKMYGVYGRMPFSGPFNMDLYEISYMRDIHALNGLNGKDHRHTLGARFYSDVNESIDYSSEWIYQLGKLDYQDIRAWASWNRIGYRWLNVPWKPTAALRMDVASGDHNKHDNKSNTFDPLFPANGKLYGNAELTTFSNIIAVGPQMSFSPHPDVIINPMVLSLWRESDDDAAYMPGMRAIGNSANVDGKHLGTDYDISVRWMPTENLTIDMEYLYYDVGSVIKRAGGQDTQYISVRTSFLF